MAIALYMDHQVPIAITNGLRLRGIDVLTAYEDGAHELADPDLLDRAGAYRRVLFTRDDDFLVEASPDCKTGFPFMTLFTPISCVSPSVNVLETLNSSPR